MSKPKRFQWRGKNGYYSCIGQVATAQAARLNASGSDGWEWRVTTGGATDGYGTAITKKAAQAAAQAWFDDLWAKECEAD